LGLAHVEREEGHAGTQAASCTEVQRLEGPGPGLLCDGCGLLAGRRIQLDDCEGFEVGRECASRDWDSALPTSKRARLRRTSTTVWRPVTSSASSDDQQPCPGG
jgi:hypothetical protein